MRQPALIRNWLFSQGFIVKNQNLREIARFSFIDLGMIPKLGWRRSAAFLQQLETYRKNTNDKSWSCLTHFYPRSYYLFYYYLLFWWADYCDALPEILQKPERSLIAELFFRTIVEIDKVIDEPGNGRLMLQNPVMIKKGTRSLPLA